MAKMDSRNAAQPSYADELASIYEKQQEEERKRQQEKDVIVEKGYQERKTAAENASQQTQELIAQAQAKQKLELSPENMAAKLALAEAGLNRTADGQVVASLLRSGQIEAAMKWVDQLKNDATKAQIKSNADILVAEANARGRVGAAQAQGGARTQAAQIAAMTSAHNAALKAGQSPDQAMVAANLAAKQFAAAGVGGPGQHLDIVQQGGAGSQGAGGGSTQDGQLAEAAGLGINTMPPVFTPNQVFGGRIPSNIGIVNRGGVWQQENQPVANFDPLAAMGRAPGSPSGGVNPALFGPAMQANAPPQQNPYAGPNFGGLGEWQQFMQALHNASGPKPQMQMAAAPPQTPGVPMFPRGPMPGTAPQAAQAPNQEFPMENMGDWARKYLGTQGGVVQGQNFAPGNEVMNATGGMDPVTQLIMQLFSKGGANQNYPFTPNAISAVRG